MDKKFLDVLARHVTAGELEKLQPVAQELERLSQQLAAVLGRLSAPTRPDVIAQFDAEVLACLKEIEAEDAGSATVLPEDSHGNNATAGENARGSTTESSTPLKQHQELPLDNLPPDIREWVLFNRQYFTPERLEQARQEVNMEEVEAEYREALRTGGWQLEDLLRDFEVITGEHE